GRRGGRRDRRRRHARGRRAGGGELHRAVPPARAAGAPGCSRLGAEPWPFRPSLRTWSWDVAVRAAAQDLVLGRGRLGRGYRTACVWVTRATSLPSSSKSSVSTTIVRRPVWSGRVTPWT